MMKFFNFRKPLLISILFALSILIAYLSVTINYLFSFLLFILPLTFLAFLFIKNARLYMIKNIVTLSLGIILFVLGFSAVIIKDYSYEKDSISVQNVHVVGKVTDVREADNYYIVNISDATIYDFEKEINVKHKITFFISKDKGITRENENDIISFTSDIEPNKYIYSRVSNKATKVSDIIIEKNNRVSLATAIKIKVKDNLDDIMDPVSSSLSFAMLFGESSIVDDKVYDSYSVSGIVHILAVSGLHVGFIISIFSFLFGILKIRRNISSLIISVFLIFYASICGFSSSVTRASIMAIILFYAKFRGKQYDGLNALSLAAIIILLVNPYSLFSLSFLLSFSSVFGILALTPIFSHLFLKFLPRRTSNALAVSLGATIATMPFVITYFKRISLLSLLSNFIILPIATIAYMFLFIVTVFAIIIPIIKYLYVPIDYMLRFITILVKSVSSQTKFILNITSSLIANVLFYFGIIIAGDFVFIKSKWMYYVPIFLIVVAIILSIL